MVSLRVFVVLCRGAVETRVSSVPNVDVRPDVGFDVDGCTKRAVSGSGVRERRRGNRPGMAESETCV